MFVPKKISSSLAVVAALATLVSSGTALSSDKGASVCGQCDSSGRYVKPNTALAPSAPKPELRSVPVPLIAVPNGGFETGDFTGWTVVDQTGGSGSWFIYTGTVAPLSGSTIAAPPEGTFATTTDQTGPGLHILYRDFVLPPGQTHTLSFTHYYLNQVGAFFTPAVLDFTVSPNQQYRVDIMNPAAPLASLAPGDVLATVFQTNVGDPTSLGPVPVTFDLTPFSGSTVRLRFAEVDNQSFFEAGVDAVSVSSTCAFNSEVGIWGPDPAGCGDVTSTAVITTYESESLPATFGDFSYEVQLVATRPNQPTASNTLFVRGTPAPFLTSAQRWSKGIAFNYTTNGKFSVFRYNGATATPLQSWVAPVGIALNGSGLPNTLRVDATGGTLTFSINGVAVKTITGEPLLSGQVGIGMVRSIPTTEAGGNDTLVVQSAVVTPIVGAGPRGPGGSPAKGVSPEQEKANQSANFRNPNPDPFFEGGRKW